MGFMESYKWATILYITYNYFFNFVLTAKLIALQKCNTEQQALSKNGLYELKIWRWHILHYS
jgi:hypothetical protein